jgi:hypothetical protein
VKCKKPPVLRRLTFSGEIAATKVKGWITKLRFQTERHKREQMHHPPFYRIALGIQF